MNLSAMTVRSKLAGAFGLLIAMMAATIWLALYDLDGLNRRFAGFVDGVNARGKVAEAVRAAVDRRAMAARNLVVFTNPKDLAQARELAAAAARDVERHLDQLSTMVRSPGVSQKAQGLVEAIVAVETRYGPVAQSIVAQAVSGQQDLARQRIQTECQPLLAELVATTEAYSAYTAEVAAGQLNEARADYLDQRRLLVIVALLAVALAVASAWWITRSLLRALGTEPQVLGAAAERVAAGDLAPLAGAEVAPAGSVLASLGKMQAALADTVKSVRGNAEAVATASAQIAQGTADLSQRTEEQSSALQQTAAAMEQLNQSVGLNAENARAASGLANRANEVASGGGRLMSDVVEQMQGIHDSSQRISDITGVIDGIAFQTNILALNAAVEAARAGENGRGFAVVAGEVRSLAQRSAEAAREIKLLIGTNTERITQGTQLVEQAGRTMSSLLRDVERVAGIMAEISTASLEQSRGVTQVGEAVSQMDQVTQQNAALVEESAAAAESLSNQARALVQTVAVFRLVDEPDMPGASSGKAV